jgi:hypothetical protein
VQKKPAPQQRDMGPVKLLWDDEEPSEPTHSDPIAKKASATLQVLEGFVPEGDDLAAFYGSGSGASSHTEEEVSADPDEDHSLADFLGSEDSGPTDLATGDDLPLEIKQVEEIFQDTPPTLIAKCRKPLAIAQSPFSTTVGDLKIVLQRPAPQEPEAVAVITQICTLTDGQVLCKMVDMHYFGCSSEVALYSTAYANCMGIAIHRAGKRCALAHVFTGLIEPSELIDFYFSRIKAMAAELDLMAQEPFELVIFGVMVHNHAGYSEDALHVPLCKRIRETWPEVRLRDCCYIYDCSHFVTKFAILSPSTATLHLFGGTTDVDTSALLLSPAHGAAETHLASLPRVEETGRLEKISGHVSFTQQMFPADEKK